MRFCAGSRAPLDNEYILGLLWPVKRPLILAAVTLVVCTSINLTSPVLSGMLFDTLVQQRPLTKYAELFGILLGGYLLEPLLSRLYMENVMVVGEQVRQQRILSSAFP